MRVSTGQPRLALFGTGVYAAWCFVRLAYFGPRMTTTSSLDRAKFAEVRALYLSTTYVGVRQAAQRKMELLAEAAGLTVEQAAGSP